MIFNSCDKRKIVCSDFPQFVLAKCNLTFVSQFKYLGHIIEHSFSDDADISRELKSLFARTNLLIRRFARCSSYVKAKLFRLFVLCFYDIALWNNFQLASLKKLAFGCVKSLKLFFGFPKYSSVTAMLMQLRLPSFDTVLHNAKVSFCARLKCVKNGLFDVLGLH